MRKNKLFHWAIGCIALAIAASLWAQNPKTGSSETKARAWEHLALENADTEVTKNRELARKINQLGDEGWELVDVESVADASKIVFFFKRPK